MVGKILIKMV